MPILTLDEAQKQLEARRLENEELRLRLARLENKVAALPEATSTATTVQGNGIDAYLNKDTVYHKLKHLFEKAVTFIVALTVPNGGTGAVSFTATRVLLGNGTSAITESANCTFSGTTLTISNRVATGDVTCTVAAANNAGVYSYSDTTLQWYSGRYGGTADWVVFDYVGNNTAFKLQTGNKMGFFGGTPVVKQTLSAYTTNSQSAAYTSTPIALINAATLADLNTLRVAYENLRAMVDDMRTKIQTSTLVG